MVQYISKAAVVAEIERKIKKYEEAFNNPSFASYEANLIAKGGYRKLKDILSLLDTFEGKDDSLEKFKSLQHISGDLKSTLQDWGYAPNLYYFDGNWHVDWISCEGGDSIKDFTGDTVEEAINKACNWFHSTFCNN